MWLLFFTLGNPSQFSPGKRKRYDTTYTDHMECLAPDAERGTADGGRDCGCGGNAEDHGRRVGLSLRAAEGRDLGTAGPDSDMPAV